MRRRDLILTGLAAALPSVPALPQARTHRIGWLGNVPPSTPQQQAIVDAFLQALREHGFIEGQNITIERRHSYGQETQHSTFAAELVGMNVDLIVAVTAGAATAASRATSSIPIVTVDGSDPERQGLVTSFARPGGNVTGLSNALAESATKFFQLTREALPNLSRVAILWNPDNPGSAHLFREINIPNASEFGLTVISVEVRGPGDLEQAFGTVLREKAEILYVHAGLFAHQHPILAFAAANRLPVLVQLRHWAGAGALMTFSPDLRHQFRRVGEYVVKILKGAQPADLPVERPTKFDLLLNLKTARSLGLEIPLSVQTAADGVIE
jgi:putative ABC transport system substrate-binding protein